MDDLKSLLYLLDGAMGSELERQGFDCRAPLWSARVLIEAPEAVRKLHVANLRAGADIITTATFRTSRYALAEAGLATRAEALTALAAQLAREAIREVGQESARTMRVAGSMAPLEDCYHPERRPADEILLREHGQHARSLKDAGVDLILVETQGSAREAQLATEMALNTGLEVWTSFLPRSGAELWNGDALDEAALAVFALGAHAILVNCCPPQIALDALHTLKESIPDQDLPLGAYPNLLSEAQFSPADFAAWGREAWKAGARIIGGCCGCGAGHIAELAREFLS